jgi:hypothetical protein
MTFDNVGTLRIDEGVTQYSLVDQAHFKILFHDSYKNDALIEFSVSGDILRFISASVPMTDGCTLSRAG